VRAFVVRRLRISGLIALLLGAALVGCGYGFVRYRGELAGVQTLAIRTPSNESMEPGLEVTVAEALRREALQRGGLRLVGKDADLLLTGEVRPLGSEQSSFSSVLLALEYRVTLTLQLRLLGRDGSPRLAEPIVVSESDRFLASPDVEVLRKNRDEALRRLATLLAERCFDLLYEVLSQPAPEASGEHPA
jgi:hypothetical protein